MELPDHSSLKAPFLFPTASQSSGSNGSGSMNRPSLNTFLNYLLLEALDFTENRLAQDFTTKSKKKKSKPSTSSVELLSHKYSSSQTNSVNWMDAQVSRAWSGRGVKPAEHWFARKSKHVNSSDLGTAAFDEFDHGLREEHPEHEMAYTPGVYDCYGEYISDSALRFWIGLRHLLLYAT